MSELTYAALRQIMYQPSAVWLATEYSGDRWLTDQFVMLNVTGHPALVLPPSFGDLEGREPGDKLDLPPHEIPDGPYKLMADSDRGFEPRDSIPEPDVEAYFAGITGTWLPALPTQWSVAEHPGKAMLWHARALPCLVGESTWTAIKRHYPDCQVWWLRERNLFKFCPNSINEDLFPFCFAAGIRVPAGQEAIASEVARLNYLTQLAPEDTLEGESTSNEEQE